MPLHRKPRAGETWKQYAVYLSTLSKRADAYAAKAKYLPKGDGARHNSYFGWSAAEIAVEVERRFGHRPSQTTVLRVINPEYRRNQLIYHRKLRASRSAQEKREETVARAHRGGKQPPAYRFGSPEHQEHMQRLGEERRRRNAERRRAEEALQGAHASGGLVHRRDGDGQPRGS